ncbi:MAG: triose-phosphate isomerase [Blastopirellula sp.]|nr:MAG: triose-phosphate isomerase [Blastopirellula sp.]
MPNNTKLWIGTSWKMNKVLDKALEFANGLLTSDSQHDDRIQRFVIPSFPLIRPVKERLASTSVRVGAQNMHWKDSGAWTGEVSAPMLTDCNLDIVELGHSERREFFNETDETVGLKVETAVRHGLIPLICIGESLTDKQSGEASAVLEAQVRAAFGLLDETQRRQPVLLAYEPVWAIGDGGTPASSGYANSRQSEIKAVALDVLGRNVPCLYGGSVNAENCAELVSCSAIDGLFIGRSAWDIDGYLNILKRASETL